MAEPRGKPTLEILRPGMLTSVQDKGRFGYQRFGMPVAGAMDSFALRCANLLVGNADGDAALEATVLGPQIRLLADTCFAITGADVQPMLDGLPVPMWQAVYGKAGDILAFGTPRDGIRAYLAIAGGVDVPLVMGSRSTYMKAGIGGLDGRALKAGDVLHAGAHTKQDALLHGQMPSDAVPQYGREHTVRVVLGPQDSAFTDAGIRTFLSAEYAVSIHTDRMGCRLEGPPVEHISGPDVISDGTPMGAVQVPGDGQPIILLADRGTTGGYTKIATVATVDISKIAQAMPGNTLRFRAVPVEEAQAALHEQEALLDAIRQSTDPAAMTRIAAIVNGEVVDIPDADGVPVTLLSAADSARTGSVTVGGQTFDIDIRVRRRD